MVSARNQSTRACGAALPACRARECMLCKGKVTTTRRASMRKFLLNVCLFLSALLLAAANPAQAQQPTGPAPHTLAWLAHSVSDCTNLGGFLHTTYFGESCLLSDATKCPLIPNRSLALFTGGNEGPIWVCLRTPEGALPGQILHYEAFYLPARDCQLPYYRREFACFRQVIPPQSAPDK